MEITNTIRDGEREIENSIRIEGGNYIHRQVEKREGLVFMRLKTRKMFDVTTV